MFAAMKSEFRKLLTVRSTYVIVGLALLLVVFFAFYATGLKVAQAALADPKMLAGQAQQAIASTGLLGSLVAVLLVTHEYRYNTIMYTLSASNSRTKTFFAKFFVATLFALFFALLVGVLAPALTSLAIHIKGFDMVPQKLDIVSLLWTVLYTGWGYTVLAFVFAMIIRLQVGAISALFLFPAMGESLLGLLLKAKAIYLPFNSLQAVVGQASPALLHVSPGKGAAIFFGYAAFGLFISWILFLRRDAI
jgi:ABC-type transport system involved in multi-copper enzyme maturation permease subunit